MNRRPRSAAVPLILLLVIALAAGMLMGAAGAKADPPVNHGQDRGVPPGVKVVPPAPADPANPGQDNGTLPGAPAVLPVPDFVTPDLGAVPDVVKVKSTKHAPQNVKFDGEPMPGGITTGTGTAIAAAGEALIGGIPAYYWRDGCGPTAVGMVVGYYDGNGWPDLIPGDATSDTPAVDQVICSHSTNGTNESYEDYALPKETSSAIVPDMSSTNPAGAHASDSVADFMHTSWSADSLQYGWSYSNMVGPAFTNYAKLRYPGSTPTSSTYYGASLTWTLVKQEVGAGRPMIFLVDSSGDGLTDHFVTIVGYRETNGYPEYACWDTWSTTLVRWQQFRAMSSSYSWGVWGGFTLSLSGSTTPTPTPTPTPPPVTPTPTPTPTVTDKTSPVTAQSGADDAWHTSSMTVRFSATDDASGVAYTEYQLDGGAWTRGSSVSVAVARKTVVAVVHTLAYRSADNAGNVETARSCVVKIDTTKPVTSSTAGAAASAGSFSLGFSANDTGSGVAATYFSVDGRSYQPGTSVTLTGVGRHTVRFYSVDRAGNVESTKTMTVRIT